MIVYLLYILVLLAFLPISLVSFNFVFFQLSPFRALVLLLPFLIILESAFRKEQLYIIPKKKNSSAVKFYFFWFAYAVISALWVKDYHAWVRSIYFLGLGLLSVTVVNMYFSKVDNLVVAFSIIGLMMSVATALGWYEYITQHYLFLDSARSLSYARSKLPVAWFYNTNDFATFLLIGTFVSYVLVKLSSSKILKIVSFVTILLGIPLLFLSKSRANIVGFIISAMTFGGVQ